jgi:hypothetical protein
MKPSITYPITPAALLLVFLWFMPVTGTPADTAETQVSISASNNLVFIGDKIDLNIIVKTTHENVREIKLPPEKMDFDILDQPPTEKRRQTDYIVFEKRLVIAFFNTGDFEIGPFDLQLIKEDGTIETKKTNSIPVTVKSVLKEEDKDIKPLKGLIDIKGNPWYLLKYVAAALALLGLVVFLILWIRKRRKTVPLPPKPLMSPLEELEFHLKQLAEKKLIEAGKLKLHFIELTRVIKYFLHRHYGFNAEDFTTEETLYYLKKDETESLILDNLRFVLNTADLVKFAKFIPAPPIFAEINGKIQEMVTRYKLRISPPSPGDSPRNPSRNLPPGGGPLYAAQFGGVGFHSSPGDGAYASLPQNENSYTMNLTGKTNGTPQ